MPLRWRHAAFLLSFQRCVLPLCFSQGDLPDSLYIKEHYTKHEYRIPMRDGVRLFTSAFVPRDTTRSHPILLMRTPYSVGPYGAGHPYPSFVGVQESYYFRQGYIMVRQDVRGRFMSEGEFEDVRPYKPQKETVKDIDEVSDTYDTVEWLITNIKGNNGRVGIKGISYPGFYAWMGTIDAHPAVKATSPQAPVSQWMGGDDWYHNGAFFLAHAFNFYIGFGWPRKEPSVEHWRPFRFGTPDGYRFYLDLGALPSANARHMHDSVAMWNNLMKHGTWDGFWKERSVLPHLKNLKPATLVVGGWYDTENLYGALRSYEAAEAQNPDNRNSLVMGPWAHHWWVYPGLDSLGEIKFGSNTTKFYAENVEVPFFEYYLNDGPEPAIAEATVFCTGTNEWKMFSSWPPANLDGKRIYLREGNMLSFEPPGRSGTEFDEYTSDPRKPVPYTAETRQWYNAAFMLEDQRFAARRPDVLMYQSDILAEDVTVAGPVGVELVASTSGTDCDWIVKVIDVFPDTTRNPSPNPRQVQMGGYQMLVRGDVLRGKFRNSLSKPEPFSPNKPTPVSFLLQDAFHTFKKSHRIMVQIQSTWFPMVDRNPGKFMDIYNAKDEDFRKTTQRVYRSQQYASHLVFGILK